MKKAAIQDHWNKLINIPARSRGIVRISQVSAAGNKTIEPKGLSAIVGLNGSGKSSFFEFLTDATYGRLPFLVHEIALHDGSVRRIPGEQVAAQIVDASSSLRKNNEKLASVGTMIGQQDLINLKEEESSLINYVLGSNYDSFSIEEIEISDSDICTRFIAKKGQLTLDSSKLSLGEQLVMYIYWSLTKKFTTPGIYLLEEPESGLAPTTQTKLVDLLAYISSEKGKQIIISTHSPFIVSRLGHERVILLKKSATSEWINAGQFNYLEELGMDLGLRGIFYVEDNKARVFLKKLLSVYGSDLSKTHEVIFLGGESHVYEVVSRLPIGISKLKTIAILDADQKGIQKYNNFPNSFFFLPGTQPPEQEVINAVTVHRREFSKALMVKEAKVDDAMRGCTGYDQHDFFEEFSRKLYGKEEVSTNVYENAFGVWFRNHQNRQEVHDLIKALDPSISQENIDEVDQAYPVQILQTA